MDGGGGAARGYDGGRGTCGHAAFGREVGCGRGRLRGGVGRQLGALRRRDALEDGKARSRRPSVFCPKVESFAGPDCVENNHVAELRGNCREAGWVEEAAVPLDQSGPIGSLGGARQ